MLFCHLCSCPPGCPTISEYFITLNVTEWPRCHCTPLLHLPCGEMVVYNSTRRVRTDPHGKFIRGVEDDGQRGSKNVDVKGGQ